MKLITFGSERVNDRAVNMAIPVSHQATEAPISSPAATTTTVVSSAVAEEPGEHKKPEVSQIVPVTTWCCSTAMVKY